MPLPKFLPFDVFQGQVSVVDAIDMSDDALKSFKIELREGYRAIEATVRCVTPDEDGSVVNSTVAEVEGERKFFELIRKGRGERIGGLIFNAINIEQSDRSTIIFSMLPTPAMGRSGADIWGAVNTAEWATAVAGLLRELLNTTITSDQGHAVTISGLAMPRRINGAWPPGVGAWESMADLTKDDEVVGGQERRVIRKPIVTTGRP